MKDIEPIVFTTIKAAILAVASTANVTGTYINESVTFPAVSVEEITNTTHLRSLTLSNVEELANIVYEFNIYTAGADKKTKGKEIRKSIDDAMFGMGFRRTFCEPIPNLANGNIFRYLVRYSKIN